MKQVALGIGVVVVSLMAMGRAEAGTEPAMVKQKAPQCRDCRVKEVPGHGPVIFAGPEAPRPTAPRVHQFVSEARSSSLEGDLPPAFNHRFFRVGQWGNHVFSAGYVLDTRIDATQGSAGSPGRLEAGGVGSADAVVFERRTELARGRAVVTAVGSNPASGFADLYILGQLVYHQPLTARFEYATPRSQRTLVDVIYPIPLPLGASVTLRGTVTGSAALSASGLLTAEGPRLSVKPEVDAHATASVSGGYLVVGARVEGNVDLIDLRAPMRGEARWLAPDLVSWLMGVDHEVLLMAGKLQVLGWAGPFEVGAELADWPGYFSSGALYQRTGTTKLKAKRLPGGGGACARDAC